MKSQIFQTRAPTIPFHELGSIQSLRMWANDNDDDDDDDDDDDGVDDDDEGGKRDFEGFILQSKFSMTTRFSLLVFPVGFTRVAMNSDNDDDDDNDVNDDGRNDRWLHEGGIQISSLIEIAAVTAGRWLIL